jgi:hypothetical protein
MEEVDSFADWRELLAKVEGVLVGRERRVGCAELLKLVGADNFSLADRNTAGSEVRKIMTSLGWTSKVAKIDGRPVRGYVRPDPDTDPADQPEPEPVLVNKHPALTDNSSKVSLPQQLESVTALALEQAKEILMLPIEGASGNELRAKCSIISSTLVTQTKADEHVLRSKGQGDVLERLGKLIRQVKRGMPKPTKPPKAAAIQVEG